MMFRISGLLFILFLAGCSHSADRNETPARIPEDSLISRKQMVKITADIHYLEAVMLKRHISKKINKGLSAQYYNALFSKYRISAMRYRQNLGELQKDAKQFISFYDSVIGELDHRIDSTGNVLKKTSRKR
jgi:hypothetical protein